MWRKKLGNYGLRIWDCELVMHLSCSVYIKSFKVKMLSNFKLHALKRQTFNP